MMAIVDPFQAYRERLDPRVSADLGVRVVEVGSNAGLLTDRDLEGWVEGVSEADLESLEKLGERSSGWTLQDSESAGFALAVRNRIDRPDAVERWFRRYRPVLGARVCCQIEAQAAYRSAQVRTFSDEDAKAMADHMAGSVGSIPENFTNLDPERGAIERAARHVAAVRELRSRELGITTAPPEASLGAHVFPQDPSVAEAVERCEGGLIRLGDHKQLISRHAESIVESFGNSDLKALDALAAKLMTEMKPAAGIASVGRISLTPEVLESLRLSHQQKNAGTRYVEAMREAGDLKWGVDGPSDPVERRTLYGHALDEAARHRETVEELDAKPRLHDAGNWLGGEDCDQQTRGFAVHAVYMDAELARQQAAVERSQQRASELRPPDLGSGYEL